MTLGFPSLNAQRSDGYSDGINTFQGVRAYDPNMNQWTTPDAYAGDVHDPMSQKPYMWNANNPVQYSDPSGYVGEQVLVLPAEFIAAGTLVFTATLGIFVGATTAKAGNGDDTVTGYAKNHPSDAHAQQQAMRALAGPGTGSPGGGDPQKKVPKSGSGKEKATDIPSWARATGARPNVNQSGSDFARRLMDEQYGKGNWDKNTGDGEFSKIQKYADRNFKNPPTQR